MQVSTPDGPLVSIVTPSFNMARFLALTIESVLSQDYPHIEYAVRDGGSTDGTVDLLHGYGDRIRWISRKDGGASDAIRAGFAESRGAILAWLNADDILLPGAVSAAVRAFAAYPLAPAVYGGAAWIDEDGSRLRPYPTQPFSRAALARECILCQPACFFRAGAYHSAGGIDPALQSAFDYELWMRLSRAGDFVMVPGEWAYSRMHRENKSLREREVMFREGIASLRRHFGYVPCSWIYNQRVFRADRRDQFFEPFQPSLAQYIASLPAGLTVNWRHPFRYTLDWLGGIDWRRRFGLAKPLPR
jgi:glycosyltransferase involved in cell wall biosynthesis